MVDFGKRSFNGKGEKKMDNNLYIWDTMSYNESVETKKVKETGEKKMEKYDEEIVTTDISRLGSRGRQMLKKILEAWDKHGLPDDFGDNEVVPMINMDNGYVFLANSDAQLCIEDGGKLYMLLSCPECGFEGSIEELKEDGAYCCKSYACEHDE